AGVQDRQAGCSGRAGGSQTRTAWPVPGGGRVGRCARGDRAASRDGDRTGGGAASVSGKIALGLTTGPVPVRVDAHVKAGLLDLVDHALEAGWSRRRACRLLDLDEDRTADWLRRRRDHGLDGLVDAAPGGGAVHGCWMLRSKRFWRCSRPGVRSTAHTASWLTAAPGWTWCTSRNPPSVVFSQVTAWFCVARRRGSRPPRRRGRTGWSGN